MNLFKNSQITLICLLLCIAIAKQSHHESCNQIQWLQKVEEEQLRSSIAKRQHAVFAEDQAIFKILDFLMRKSTHLSNMVKDKGLFLMTFNIGYIITLAFILVCFFSYPDSKNYYKINFLPSDEVSKQKWRKAIIVLICVICLLAFTQALRGMNEAGKLKKSLYEVYCKILEQPKGLIRRQNGTEDIGYASFKQYNKEAVDTLLPNAHILRATSSNILMAWEYLNISKAIINHLQKDKNSFNFLTEFRQSVSNLQIIYDQDSNQTIATRIHQLYFIEQIRQANIFEFQVLQKSIQSYGSLYDSIINIWVFLYQGFFFLISCCSILIASFLMYNSIFKKNIQPSENIVVLVQLLLCVFIFVCVISFVFNSLILIISGIAHSSIQRMTTTPQYFLQQFSSLKLKQVPLAILRLAPFNITLKSIDNGRYLSLFTHYENMFGPYASKKPTYLYDMLNESLSYIKDDRFKQEIIGLIKIKERVLNEPFAAHFKTMHQIFKKHLNFIEKDGLYDRLYGGAVGGIIVNAVKRLFFFLVNRSFQNHEICGRLSILLSVLLLLVLVINRERQQSEQGQKTALSMIEAEEKSLILEPTSVASTNSLRL